MYLSCIWISDGHSKSELEFRCFHTFLDHFGISAKLLNKISKRNYGPTIQFWTQTCLVFQCRILGVQYSDCDSTSIFKNVDCLKSHISTYLRLKSILSCVTSLSIFVSWRCFLFLFVYFIVEASGILCLSVEEKLWDSLNEKGEAA